MSKDHYVPAVYLRHFTRQKSGFFYRARSKPYFLDIMKRHVENVCFEDDFYTLTRPTKVDDISIEDPKFVEQKAFPYENRLENIFLNFTRDNQRTDVLKISELVDAVLSMKHRTKFFRKEFQRKHANKTETAEILDARGKELFTYLTGVTSHPPEMISEKIEAIKQQLLYDATLPVENHKQVIIQSRLGTNQPMQDAKNVLMTMKIFVLRPANPESYFVTTDNPGFSWLGNQIFNTNFGKFDAFGFPLTSRDLIYFVQTGSHGNNEFQRPIYRNLLNEFQVNLINTCSILNCDESIFCESKKYLQKTLEWYHSSKKEGAITDLN